MAAMIPEKIKGRVNKFFMYSFRNGGSYIKICKNVEGNEIEKCSPEYSLERCQYFCRNNGSYRIGLIMETIDIIEY